MNVLSRSIFRELLITFLLGTFALNLLLVTEKIIRLTKKMASVGLSPSDMLSVLVYLQPIFTIMTVPMALFFSILIVYGRLNADNEIVIMRANGMSFLSISSPAFTLGIICLLVTLSASFWIAPAGAKKLRAKVTDIISSRAPQAIQEGIFNTMFEDVVIFVADKDDSGVMSGMFMYDGRNAERPTVVYARQGQLTSEGGFSILMEMTDGHINFLGKNATTDLTYDKYRLRVPMEVIHSTKPQVELTPFEILKAVKTVPESKVMDYLLEFHRRLTFPFLCIVLMVFAPPLAFMAGKTGKVNGLATGFLVIAAYYGLLIYAEELVRVNRVSVLTGSWLPTVLFFTVAVILFRREARR
jgi:lipopolysaccharide export system permease protein